MRLELLSAALDIEDNRKGRRKRRPLYFSSSKALQRARMARSKKTGNKRLLDYNSQSQKSQSSEGGEGEQHEVGDVQKREAEQDENSKAKQAEEEVSLSQQTSNVSL